MLRVLVLQNWYNLSDQEMEFQLADRISFQHFIDSAEIPDFSTIWRFRERLNKSKLWKKIWSELQRQLEDKNLKIKKGHAQKSSIFWHIANRRFATTFRMQTNL
jgi:IS5 family transposase